MANASERLLTAQHLKKEAVKSDDQKVAMPLGLAALAFGIPETDLIRLSEQRLSLIIQPRDEAVIISLQPSIADWRRDLWEEMLQTMEKGRSETGEVKEAYLFAFGLTQRLLTEQREGIDELVAPKRLLSMTEFQSFWDNLQAGGSIEFDPEFLQILLYSLFSVLPKGSQQELVNKSFTPWEVMANL